MTSEAKARDENDKTPTNRTTGASAATGSSAFPALSLAADVVVIHTGQTIAANHPCWVVEGRKEFKTTVQIQRHSTTPVKARARAESPRTPTLTNFASLT